ALAQPTSASEISTVSLHDALPIWVLKLLKPWLEAGVMEDGVVSTVAGMPQGGVTNIYAHALDELWSHHSAAPGTLVRHADNFVVVCRLRRDCEQPERISTILKRLGRSHIRTRLGESSSSMARTVSIFWAVNCIRA